MVHLEPIASYTEDQRGSGAWWTMVYGAQRFMPINVDSVHRAPMIFASLTSAWKPRIGYFSAVKVCRINRHLAGVYNSTYNYNTLLIQIKYTQWDNQTYSWTSVLEIFQTWEFRKTLSMLRKSSWMENRHCIPTLHRTLHWALWEIQ